MKLKNQNLSLKFCHLNSKTLCVSHVLVWFYQVVNFKSSSLGQYSIWDLWWNLFNKGKDKLVFGASFQFKIQDSNVFD